MINYECLRAKKEFCNELNVIGVSYNNIDQGVYFNDLPLRDSTHKSTLGKYDVSLRLGEEFQPSPLFGGFPEKVLNIKQPVKGPYNMGPIYEYERRTISATSWGGCGYSSLKRIFSCYTSSSSLRIGTVDENGRYPLEIQNNTVFEGNYPATYYSSSLGAYGKESDRLEGNPVASFGAAAYYKVQLLSDNLTSPNNFLTSIPTALVGDKNRDYMIVQVKRDGRPNHTLIGTISVDENGTLTSSLDNPPTTINNDGARTGKGSRDVREEGGPKRDFVNWQNFVPQEKLEKTYLYTNYDENIRALDVNLQIDQLYDTKSFATAKENEKGRSKMGTQLPLTITFEITVGVAKKDGTKSFGPARFTTRSAKGIKIGSGNGRISVTGIVTSAYTVSLENISLPLLGTDDLYTFLEVRKIEYETISSIVERNGGVHSVVEKVLENFVYPNSCTVATSIDSRYYPEIPERTFRLKGKKVLIPSNYFPLNSDGTDKRFSTSTNTRGNLIYQGPWDGTFKFDWTDNPAWIYYDLLVNTRYGIGAQLRDTSIVDKWSLYEIGMYCDAVTMNDGSKATVDAGGAGYFVGMDDGYGGLEPRFSCNLYIKDQKDAIEVLQDLSRTFGAMTYYNNSFVGVRVDRPHFFEDFNRTTEYEQSLNAAVTSAQSDEFTPPKNLRFPPHLMFNNGNVKDGQFVYADTDKTQKLSAVEVSFLDKTTNFTPKTEYVEDPELIKQVGINLKQIPGIGVTSRAQAKRLAKYLLFESTNATETVTFNVGYEGLMLEPGDIIKIDDQLRNFSKNFGTVLGTSGETQYIDPDYALNGNPKTGKGPSSIIVEPSINSDQLDLISEGSIHVFNGFGKSGIDEFYKNPPLNNEVYQKIHSPQMTSLKIVQGGSGLSYDILDEGVAIHIDALATFSGNNDVYLGPSQWFSEQPADIIPGSKYSIDVSGRAPKYFRVMNVSENPEMGYDVVGLIHHTGKFKFIEENVAVDLDESTFQPDFKISDIGQPNPPSAVSFDLFIPNADGSLRAYLNIQHAQTKAGQRFIVYLEEPNGNQIISTHDRNFDQTNTRILLEGSSKIDQIGEYEVVVFSETLSPIPIKSLTAASTLFTAQASDFGLNTASDAYVDYSDINILTDFNTEYNNQSETGLGQVSFIEKNPEVLSTLNMSFEDYFSNDEFTVKNSVSSQIVNLYDLQGNLRKEGFKTLGNEDSFTVTKQEIDEAFDYSGDGRYDVPPTKFQGNFFVLSGSGDMLESGQRIDFELTGEYLLPAFADPVPMVFIQQFIDAPFESSYDKIKDVKHHEFVSSDISGFWVRSYSKEPANYYYFSAIEGRFNYGENLNTIEVQNVNQLGQGRLGEWKSETFQKEFNNPPIVVLHQQSDITSLAGYAGEGPVSTEVRSITRSGFEWRGHVEGGPLFDFNLNGYLAVDTKPFNILKSSSYPINSLNIAVSGYSNFLPLQDDIMQEFNNTSDYRFGYRNQMIFPQPESGFDDRFIVIHRDSGVNRAVPYPMVTEYVDPGIKSNNNDALYNQVTLDLNSDYTTLTNLNNNFLSTSGFEVLDTGDLTVGDTRFKFENTSGPEIAYATIELGSIIANNTTINVEIDIAQITGQGLVRFTDTGTNFVSEKTLLNSGNQTLSFDLTGDAYGMYIELSGAPISTLSGDSIIIYEESPIQYQSDLSFVTWAKFSENLTGKQYLMEYMSEDGQTGIAWFQSGDGSNYININGTDFKTIDTAINDGNLHMLQIAIDRDVAISGYLDGVVDYTNTGITGANFTGDLYPGKNEKILLDNNSSLFGESLTQGIIYNYIAFITGESVAEDYYSNTSYGFKNNFLFSGGFETLDTGDLAAGDIRFLFRNENDADGQYNDAVIELESAIPSGTFVNLDINVTNLGRTWIYFTDALNNEVSQRTEINAGFRSYSFDISDDAVGFGIHVLGGATAFVSGTYLKIFENPPGDPSVFFDNYAGSPNTDFIISLSGDNFPLLTDASLTYPKVEIKGAIEQRELLFDHSLPSNLNFIQIGNTGTI